MPCRLARFRGAAFTGGADRRRLSNQGTNRSVTIGATPLGTKRTKTRRTAPSTTLALTTCWVPIFTVSHEIATAPITGPSSVPTPPTMSQMIICADCTTLNTGGLT